MKKVDAYKVILTFNLKGSQADEELKRSNEKDSFPNMLAQQPGFIELELVRVNESKTLSIQTWGNRAILVAGPRNGQASSR